MSRKRVTIRHVAEEAGVSTQTVSRVANNRPDVADATRRHVQEVIDRLGYSPSKVARSLIQGQSYTLGVVCYGLSLYGPSLLLEGIQKASVEAGYSLMLKIVPDPEAVDAAEVLQSVFSYHVDGVLWAVPEIGRNRDWILGTVSDKAAPVVFLNSQPRPNLVTAVVNNRQGGRLASQHLIDLDRRHIGIITGPMAWWEARQRELGWREALVANGRAIDESSIANGDWTPLSGERSIRSLLEWHPEMDAVFVCNDQMALGAMKVAHRMGRKIPDDLAVVGFDDIPESPYFSPALSTVRQDVAELGYRSVGELLALLESGEDKAIQNVVIEPELIVRESSAAKAGP